MAGHSKWAQIKRKKAVTDARRGQLFTRILKEVTVAARLGGGDPAGNPRLRIAVQEARAANVPNENIERALRKGTGELAGVSYEEITYEGYGPGGIAILVETVTDNRNRTVSEVRNLFSRHGGNLGEGGSVAWMFEKRGYFVIERSALGEEELMELALGLGAEDISIEEDSYAILTAPEAFAETLETLETRGIEPVDEQLAMLPKTTVDLDAGTAPQALRLLEALEEHEDVEAVWSNLQLAADAPAEQTG